MYIHQHVDLCGMMPHELTVQVSLCFRVIRCIIGIANAHEAVVVACFKGLRAACCYRTSLDDDQYINIGETRGATYSIHFIINRIAC
jgi:hypothetical protein